MKQVIEIAKGDSDLKYEFLESALDDDKVLTRIAKSMFRLPAKDIGIGGPGSIADFFRPESDS